MSDAPQRTLPDFVKRVHRVPSLVVEKEEGQRRIYWDSETSLILLNGSFSSDELHRLAEMMERERA